MGECILARLDMPRVCSFSRLSLAVLLLAGLGSVAWAKPKVAILGLEAANSGVVDPKDATNAAKLTDELRRIPRTGGSKYELAPNSNRELQDEKLMGNCDTEKAVCMAPIGQGLGADYLVYGKIVKAVVKGKDGYTVTIRVLNVKKREVEGDKTSDTFVPLGDFSSGAALGAWAAKAYAKLSGEKPPVIPDRVAKGKGSGKLVVNSNVQDGAVFIGSSKKGRLSGGSITLTLPDGTHELAIEAPDHKRYEATVTVAGGKTRTVDAQLEEMLGALPPPPPPPGGDSSAWRKVMWASVGTGLVAGGVWVYGAVQLRDINDQLCGKPKCTSSDPPMSGVLPEKRANLESRGERWALVTYGMAGVVGVATVFTVIGTWKGYFSKSGEQEQQAGVVGKRKRRELTVTPVISPDGGGATLRFDW